MVEVEVEIRVPEARDVGVEVDLNTLALDIDNLEITTRGTVPVRRSRRAAVITVRGTSPDPHRLAQDPNVVGVWIAGKPLWDSSDADDASRYAF